MAKTTLRLLSLVVLLSCAASSAHAQDRDSGVLYRIETTGGSIIQGTLIRFDSTEIVLDVESVGTITIARSDIVRFEQITPDIADASEERKSTKRIPIAQQALLQPNGFGLDPGEGEYQNVFIFFNTATVGLHRNFSIGFGLVPTFLLGIGEFPAWINPKISASLSPTVHVAAGGLLATVVGDDDAVFGVLHAATTFGTRDEYVNLGAMVPFEGSGVLDDPFFSVSGLTHTSDRWALMVETFLVPTEGPEFLLGLGARHEFPTLALDFGLVVPIGIDTDDLLAVPWLGIRVPFGSR